MRFISFRLQVVMTWLVCFIAFTLLLKAFNLSFDYMLFKLPLLLSGVGMTLIVSVSSILFASILAFLLALSRLSNSGVLVGISGFYISFFRGTPLLLQVFIIYVGLPQVGIVLPAVPSGIIALSCNYSAYMSEIFRAGIVGIPKGQREAGISLGLNAARVMHLIVLPQAFRLVLPPIGNMFIAMLKDSSLVSILGVWELMFIARSAGRADFKHFEMLITAALIYWVLSFLLESGQRLIELRFGESKRMLHH